ncbi:MAG TPA: hypothetical protein QF651_11170, partial [Acidimicrobiales bacterium]|nr:hypothetical protein [Acidimicrobiales bacterium]
MRLSDRDRRARAPVRHLKCPDPRQTGTIHYSRDRVLVAQLEHLGLQKFTLADSDAPVLVDDQAHLVITLGPNLHYATARSTEATPWTKFEAIR